MNGPIGDPTERIRELERRVEELAAMGHWDDREIQEALIAVARAHLWKQGLWVRVKFAVNVVGFLGVIGGGVLAVLALLGMEVVRR